MKSFRAILDQFDDIVSIHDLRGKCLYINPAQEGLMGFADEDILGKTPYQWVHSEDRMPLRQAAQALQRHGFATLSWRCRKKEGGCVWLETRIRLLLDPDGWPEYFLCVSRDISAHKAFEAAKVA